MLPAKSSALLFLLPFVVMVAGCAGSDAAKETARASAELLQQYQQEAGRTLVNQRNVEASILEEITRTLADVTERRARLIAATDGWKIEDDKRAQSAYAALTGDKAEAVLAVSPLLGAPAATPSAPKLAQDYENALKAISELTEFGSARGRFEFLVDLIGTVGKQIGDAK